MVRMRVNSLPHNPDFLTTMKKKAFEIIMGKGENAGNQGFLLFPMSSTLPKTNFQFFSHIYFAVCKCFQFGEVQNFIIW